MNALGTPAAEAARVLSGLSEGERAWFWWRAGSQAALLLQPLSLDPTMARLKAQISGISPAAEARPVSGILQVGQGGRIGLLSASAGDGVLPALAGWVLDNHTTHPDLARLHRAQFYETSAGTVSAVFEDDALWAELPEPTTLDDRTRAAGVLRGLGEGERAWIWMALTSGGRAVMLAAPVSEDADGERIAARARALRLGGGVRDALQGIARREGRVLTLTTGTYPAHWSQIVAALIGQGGGLFRPLRRARLIHLDGSVQKTEALPPHRELSETAAILRSQSGGWFWFSTATRHGSPLLILRSDRDALKEAARQAGGTGATIRGRVVGGDRIELQTRDSDDLRAELLDWAKSESHRWPDLRRLKGVRINKLES